MPRPGHSGTLMAAVCPHAGRHAICLSDPQQYNIFTLAALWLQVMLSHTRAHKSKRHAAGATTGHGNPYALQQPECQPTPSHGSEMVTMCCCLRTKALVLTSCW